MEEILGQAMLPPICLTDFLREYKISMQPPFDQPLHKVSIKDVLKLDDTRFKELRQRCSLDMLAHDEDSRVAEFVPGFSETGRTAFLNVPLEKMPLQSYLLGVKYKETRKLNPFQRTAELYHNYRLPEEPCVTEPIDLLPGQELKIYIRLYRPARVTHAGRTIDRPVFSQEFECLGSNLLTELRDKIYCICNNKHFYDISENPEEPMPTKTTDPGYFFINDTFYNDKRNVLNADYSETIRTWAKKAKGLTNLNFKVAKMEETRFMDLSVSLGFPQLYQHHGNCEHVFVFSQIEIITNPTAQLKAIEKYPLLRAMNRFSGRTCNICSKVNFVFVVEGSNRLLNDPSYLCRKCFMSFHYVDGKKVGSFRAYRLNEEPLMADENTEQQANDDCNPNDNYHLDADLSDSDLGIADEVFVKEEKIDNIYEE